MAQTSRRKQSKEKSKKDADTTTENHEFWETVYRVTKVVFAVLLFLLVLGSAVVSKGCLLILTWNILKPYNRTEHQLKTFYGLFNNYDNGTIRSGDDVTETNVYYVWSVFALVTTPYIWNIIVHSWKIFGRKSDRRYDGDTDKNTNHQPYLPYLRLLIAVLPGTLHSLGLSLFVFILLPSLDPVSGLFYCSSVTLVPSIVQLIFSDKKQLRKDKASCTLKISRPLLMRVLCFIFGIVSLAFWAVYVARVSGLNLRFFLFILAPMLVSFGWWENFVPDQESASSTNAGEKSALPPDNVMEADECPPEDTSRFLDTFREQIRLLKDHSYAGRHKMHVIVNTFKVLISFAMMLSIYEAECLFFVHDRAPEPSSVIGSTWILRGGNCPAYTPFVIAAVGLLAGLMCHRFSMAAVKIVSQIGNFSLPIILVSPVTLATLWILSTQNAEHCRWPFPSWKEIGTADNIVYMVIASVTGYLSLLLLTSHVWTNKLDRMKKGHEIFLKPLYCGTLLDQSLLMNRRIENQSKVERNDATESTMGDSVPMIYLCATMWHEEENEMKQLLKSLLSMDANQKQVHEGDSDFYRIEAHIFFDDAFKKKCDCVNQYVKTFIKTVQKTARSEYPKMHKMQTCSKIATPYGGQLRWELPEGNKLIVHLKDKRKIRAKKRWSQVMYMYYFLSNNLGVEEKDLVKQKDKAKNVFILALDGDVDFRPSAVTLLVDRMRRNSEVGAACGRIHPIGSGPIVWYQKFEYAISHWLVKATEHVAGCVLCSPGCFSLFRGSALMDNVMQEYTTLSTEARHYVQYDQGEDRWLCTLLLKQGYKVDYCAASDAYTFAPESFKVFYNQRRRWTPSTMANIVDLLSSWKQVTKTNNYISLPYIVLHLFWFVSSMVTPGVLVMMIVGATKLAYSDLSLHACLLINIAPVTLFLLVCFFAKTDLQITVAAGLSIMYSLMMIIVLIGIIRQSVDKGLCSVSTPFLIGVSSIFVITAFMHPREIWCLLHGFLFFIAIPSTSILLMIYSIVNMNNVSWGTRENTATTESSGEKSLLAVLIGKLSSDNASKIGTEEDDVDNEHDGYCNFRTSTKLSDEKEMKFWEWLLRTHLHPSGKAQNDTEDSEFYDDEDFQRPEENNKNKTDENSTENRSRIDNDGVTEGSRRDNDGVTEGSSTENDGGTEASSRENHDKKRLEREERQMKANIRRQESDLKKLRNKASLIFLFINAVCITVVYFLQQVDSDKDQLSIRLKCFNDTLRLEPISLTFTVTFGLLLTIQFVCMLVHRCKTFLQIQSITKIWKRTDKGAVTPTSETTEESATDSSIISETAEESATDSSITQATLADETEVPRQIKNNNKRKRNNRWRRIGMKSPVGNDGDDDDDDQPKAFKLPPINQPLSTARQEKDKIEDKQRKVPESVSYLQNVKPSPLPAIPSNRKSFIDVHQ